LSFVSSYFCH